MLPVQGFVVGRWLPCDRILLINLCSKRFIYPYMLASLKCGGGCRQFGSQKLGKETIEILPVNIILFSYRRCSIWPPLTSIHFVYHLIMSCQTLGKILALSRMTPAATCIRATRSSCVPREPQTPGFSCTPRHGNSMVSGSGERGGQAIGPPRPIRFQRCHSTGDNRRSCGTNTSSSWSHPLYARNLSKSSARHNQAIHKIYRSWWRPY